MPILNYHPLHQTDTINRSPLVATSINFPLILRFLIKIEGYLHCELIECVISGVIFQIDRFKLDKKTWNDLKRSLFLIGYRNFREQNFIGLGVTAFSPPFALAHCFLITVASPAIIVKDVVGVVCACSCWNRRRRL